MKGTDAEGDRCLAKQRPDGDQILDWAREAWQRLRPSSPAPREVELLVRKKKSAVCRLLLPSGAVIAKRGCRGPAELEHRLHSQILPRLPLRSLGWHGMVEIETDGDPDFVWLFMEDAGESVPTREDDEPLISAWLAALHATSSELEDAPGLPERGPDHAVTRLRSSREAIRLSFEHPERPEPPDALDPLLRALDALEARWPEIEARCEGVPRTLVHGDFVRKNMRLVAGSSGPELLVFDWEFAGLGFPGQDTGRVGRSHYGDALRAWWTGIDEIWLDRLFETGWIFRVMAQIRWASTGLCLPGSHYAVRSLQKYGCNLDAWMRDRGWTSGP